MAQVVKGSFDRNGQYMTKLNYIKTVLGNLWKIYGGVEIETPIFEYSNFLVKDDSKSVYQIEGGITLRYDLTMPLVRYCISHKIDKGKFYRFGRVYRRDNPNIKDKRFREFYQFDFDIIGNYVNRELEVLLLLHQSFEKLGISNVKIRINNKQDVIDMLSNLGITNFAEICSTIDKLDKKSWYDLVPEFKEKGLTDVQIANLKTELDTQLPSPELKTICDQFTKLTKTDLQYDSSLVRGLDYYTGLIFEVNIDGYPFSVASGGVYDELIGKYSKKSKPCIGLSIGIDRLIDVINFKEEENNLSIGVFSFVGDDVKLEVEYYLRKLGKYVVRSGNSSKNIKKYLTSNMDLNFVVILDDKFIDNNKVSIKVMKTKQQIEIDFDKIENII